MKIILKKWEKGSVRRIYISGVSGNWWIASASRKTDDEVCEAYNKGGEYNGREESDRVLDWFGDAVEKIVGGHPVYFDKIWSALPDRSEAEI